MCLSPDSKGKNYLGEEKLYGLLIVLLLVASVVPMQTAAQQQPEPLVTLHYLAMAGDDIGLAIANSIKEELAKIGINMEIHTIESGTYYTRTLSQAGPKMLTYDEGGYDMTLMTYFYFHTDYTWYIGCYTAAGIPPKGWQFWAANDAIADDYLFKAMSTYDREKRIEHFWAWQQQFYENMHLVSVAHPRQAAMDNGKIKNYDPTFYNYDIDEWVIEGKTYEDDVTVRYAVSGVPNMLNPVFLDGGYPQLESQFRALYRPIRTPDGKYDLAPDMATSYEIAEDGLSVTFYLRKDVKWHDGQRFTAEDVKMTYDALLDTATGASFTADFSDAIKSVEVKDDYTVVLYLNKPAPHIVQLVSMPGAMILPNHVLGKVPHEQWRTDETNTIAPAPGTGPMKFVSWKKEEYMELEAFPDYYGKKPLVDKFVLLIIDEATVAFSALEAGDVDMIESYYAQYAPGEVKRLQQVPGLHIEPWDVVRDMFLALNWEHPFLNNKYVRFAIAHAVPYDFIINDLLYGLAIKSNSQIHPSTWAWNPNVPYVDHNLDKAREYLAKAGYVWPPPAVEVQPTGNLMLYLAAGIVVGVIVGAALGFVALRKKPTVQTKE